MAATLTTPKQHTVEHLDRKGYLHIVAVDGLAIAVRDNGDNTYDVTGRTGEYRVTAAYGKVRWCSCPAGRRGKPCRHKLATAEAIKKW
jgi:SWIM zinc finger